ncbi:MAG: hypothetical protein A3B08_03550 [Candidatus Taylorbacteria bacterium RIFCSPLOWO2_01_FULL_43_44]|nr:MAG: hypothetical protein A2743_01805 [Candidatus Taylorbacteria bacterium RIFCSPHIGHO2_01_FULL_43_47]OHA30346.1 MAG: hypothetical protein A3B08_03550 [Candidatus Taylorbacteria bacterium RIFCSPLOWO2_01_FULL_43_44]
MDNNSITYFAETDYRNRRTPFGIKASDRTRHVYVIGKTGMGKSTMLENMAIQDIRNGNGLAFVDPHGKSAEMLLDFVPQNRVKDVLYFAPFDMEYPVAFNIMEDVGPDKRHLVVNGLMSTFEKIWVDAWSARMAYILSNTLLALLEFPGSTLLGINRMLSDKEYRKLIVANIKDPSVRSFWVDEFAKYTDRFAAEATPAIQNKVGQFTSNPLIRNIIGQANSTFDLRKVMDERKILIVNLAKGRVGEGNANLLGSMIITKIYLAAMSRADASETALKNLPNFYLYVDEFQSFANKSFADILSEARKYKLNLTIAHQYIEQMEEEVRAAVFGNVGTMIMFRVGAYDAEVLEKEFAPQFTAEDLVNLGSYQIYLKLMIDGVSSSPFSAVTIPLLEKGVMSYKEDVINSSRSTFGRPRSAVENEIKIWHEPTIPIVKEVKKVMPGEQPPRPISEHGYVNRIEKKMENLPERNFSRASEVPVKPFVEAFKNITPPQKEIKVSERQETTVQKNVVSSHVPLSSLQNNFSKKEDVKVRNDNMSALREALAGVLKKSTKPEESVSHNFTKTEPKTQSAKGVLEKPSLAGEESRAGNSREVSPDVLREILKD